MLLKRLLSLLRPHVIRAIIYSSISKAVIALCVLFLWEHFLYADSSTPFSMVGTGFFAAAVWFLLGAWIQYLSFDGMHPFHIFQWKKKNRSITAMDEDELEDDELIAAKLCSNLAVALLFLIPNLLAVCL